MSRLGFKTANLEKSREVSSLSPKITQGVFLLHLALGALLKASRILVELEGVSIARMPIIYEAGPET